MKQPLIAAVAVVILLIIGGSVYFSQPDERIEPSADIEITHEIVEESSSTLAALEPATTTEVAPKKVAVQAPAPLPATLPPPLPAPEVEIVTSPATTTAPAPANITITTKAIVGLLCHGEGDIKWKGSGVIINPKGYILTNKHVADGAQFCEVAMPGNEIVLPTYDEIRERNPFPQLEGARLYKAIVYYLPAVEGLGEDEARYLDFAIMKINAVNEGCELFNTCGPLPTTFPYNPVSRYMPEQGEVTISYGYPAEGSASDIYTFRLKGVIGSVLDYIPGDQKFLDRKFVMVRLTDWGTFFGASGSGVFFNGHVIGLVYGTFEYYKTAELVIPMQIIYDVMKERGVDWILTYY